MPIDVDTSLAPRRLTFTFRGDWPSEAEQRALHRMIRKEGYLTDTTVALVDCRGLVSPGFKAVEFMAHSGIEDNAWPRVCAFLAETPAQYGMCRQLQSMAPGGTTIEIFKEKSAALAWLIQHEQP
jgi:hypothetical protein